jgi:NADH dehydrogenase [ubiquinone] 1 alpha subcomplex assembly factor 5
MYRCIVAVHRQYQRPRLLRWQSDASGCSTHKAFHRSQKRQQRNNAARAAVAWRNNTASSDTVQYDYIRDEIASRLVDRLDDSKRSFPLALDLGSGSGHVYRAICGDDALVPYDDAPTGGIGGVRKLVQLDSSHGVLHRDSDVTIEGSHRCDTYRLGVEDEEEKLPFPDGTFDLVITSCSLHWINKLPYVFGEVFRVLKPDGCFLLAMIGGTETLPELRASMVMAELEREGGFSPHVGPFVQVTDVGSLLQRAGFALPTIDVDTIRVTFPNAAVLMEHLQRMGENNASLQRRERVSLDTFLATASLYGHLFGASHEGAMPGDIEASLQIIYAIGWTPHESQPQPLERGSATHKVGDISAVEVTKTEGKGDSKP